jgi:hypothetical protein
VAFADVGEGLDGRLVLMGREHRSFRSHQCSHHQSHHRASHHHEHSRPSLSPQPMDIPDLPMLIQSLELKPLMMSVDSSGDGGVVERQNLEGNRRCGVGVAERVVLLNGQNVHGRRTDEERSNW